MGQYNASNASIKTFSGLCDLAGNDHHLVLAALIERDDGRFVSLEDVVDRIVGFRIANEKLHDGKSSSHVLYGDVQASAFFRAAAADVRSSPVLQESFIKAAKTYERAAPLSFFTKVSKCLHQAVLGC